MDNKEVRLKIVIVVSYAFPNIEGGLSNVATKQAEELFKLGHEVSLISSNVPEGEKEFKRNGVKYFKVEAWDGLNRFNIPVPLFILNKKAVALIKQADVVHVHEIFYPSSWLAGIVAKVYGKRLITTQHASHIKYSNLVIDWLMKIVKETMGRIMLVMSDRVIVVNENTQQWLRINNQKAVTLINGLDFDLFCEVNKREKGQLRKKYSLPVDKKIVLYVGRLVKKKGFEELMKAQDDRYLLLIVGNERIWSKIKHDEAKIKFINVVPHQVLSEIFKVADVFILPSFCEGFPLTIQEAMACGLPIITTKQPGYDQYLDSEFVKFIEPNSNDIKQSIIELFADKRKMNQMSKYSRRQALTFMSWKENVKKLINIYKEGL